VDAERLDDGAERDLCHRVILAHRARGGAR
jgi:hypothetical protein